MEKSLVPCPLCGKQPEHFYSGIYEVIHCKQGCKPRSLGWNIHLTNNGNRQLRGGWKKLTDRWNTIAIFEVDGKKEFKFDYYAPGEDGRIAQIVDAFPIDRQFQVAKHIHTTADKPFTYPKSINKEYVEHLIGFSKRENVQHVLDELIPDNRSECWSH